MPSTNPRARRARAVSLFQQVEQMGLWARNAGSEEREERVDDIEQKINAMGRHFAHGATKGWTADDDDDNLFSVRNTRRAWNMAVKALREIDEERGNKYALTLQEEIRMRNSLGSPSRGRTPEEQRFVDDHFTAVQRIRDQRESSGEVDIEPIKRKIEFVLWGLQTQSDPTSPTSIRMAEKMLGALAPARPILERGRPEGMNQVAWDNFVILAEEAHQAARRILDVAAQEAETVEVVEESGFDLGTWVLVIGGLGAVAGIGYVIVKKVSE